MIFIQKHREVYSNAIETSFDNDGLIVDFPDDNNNSIYFKSREKITGKTGNNVAKDVEIMAPLKYLDNFWSNFLEIR